MGKSDLSTSSIERLVGGEAQEEEAAPDPGRAGRAIVLIVMFLLALAYAFM